MRVLEAYVPIFCVLDGAHASQTLNHARTRTATIAGWPFNSSMMASSPLHQLTAATPLRSTSSTSIFTFFSIQRIRLRRRPPPSRDSIINSASSFKTQRCVSLRD